jgi:hypothetical protein
LNPGGVCHARKVRAIGGFGEPGTLAGRFAGQAARLFGTVNLPGRVAVVGQKKVSATEAFAAAMKAVHDSRPANLRQKSIRQNTSIKRKEKEKKEQEL